MAWHRLRDGYKEERTAHLNRISGLLGEFGIWPPRIADKLIRLLPSYTTDRAIPSGLKFTIEQTLQYLSELHNQIARCDQQINSHVKSNPATLRLTEIKGIGTLTASATSAMVVDAKHYKNGRQFAAWLGLVPRHMSSGGKAKLGRTRRRSGTYLRS